MWKPGFNYNDAESTYSELLEKDCAVTIHTKNLQLLVTEMHRAKYGFNPSFMKEIFCENATHYNFNVIMMNLCNPE